MNSKINGDWKNSPVQLPFLSCRISLLIWCIPIFLLLLRKMQISGSQIPPVPIINLLTRQTGLSSSGKLNTSCQGCSADLSENGWSPIFSSLQRKWNPRSSQAENTNGARKKIISGPILTIEKLFCSSSFYIIRNLLRKGGGAPGHFTFCIEFWENTQYLSSKKMFKAGAFLALSRRSDIELFAPYRFRVPFCAQNGALVTGILSQSL